MADVARGHGGDGGDLPPHNPDRILTICEASSKSKRKRGSGKNLNLIRAREKNNGPLPIMVDDMEKTGTYKFIGQYASMFPRCISNEIDKTIPYHYSCWATVPQNLREHIYDTLYHFFNIAALEEREDWRDIHNQILRDCGRRYADRKYKLGVHFKLHGGVESPDRAKKNPPKGYNMERWKALIDGLFNTPGWLRRSKANTKNRKKIPFTPLCGTESYPQKRYVKGIHDDEPNAIMVWYETHYKADWEDRGFDGFENAKALQTWHDICDERDRRRKEVDHDNDVDEADVLRHVLGETPVYIRAIGRKRAVSAQSLGNGSSQQRTQLQEQRELIEQLQKQQADMEARMEARMEEERKQMKKKYKKQEKQFKRQIKKMMKEMKNQHPGSTSGRDPQSDSD